MGFNLIIAVFVLVENFQIPKIYLVDIMCQSRKIISSKAEFLSCGFNYFKFSFSYVVIVDIITYNNVVGDEGE